MQDNNGKTALALYTEMWNVFQSYFLIQREKNDVTAWNFSPSYCAFLDFFDIESRGAIVDEAPKARVDSFAACDYYSTPLDKTWNHRFNK